MVLAIPKILVENFYKCQNFHQFGKIQYQLSQINILFYTSTANIQRRRPLGRRIAKAREVQGNHLFIYREYWWDSVVYINSNKKHKSTGKNRPRIWIPHRIFSSLISKYKTFLPPVLTFSLTSLPSSFSPFISDSVCSFWEKWAM